MTNRLKPVKVCESVVSIALRIQKMADDEIPVDFIHEIKTKLDSLAAVAPDDTHCCCHESLV